MNIERKISRLCKQAAIGRYARAAQAGGAARVLLLAPDQPAPNGYKPWLTIGQN